MPNVTFIGVTGIVAAWQKILTKVDFERRGQLRGPANTPLLVEIAFSATPTATEIVELSAEPTDIVIPTKSELWARRAGGVAGSTELHGTVSLVP